MHRLSKSYTLIIFLFIILAACNPGAGPVTAKTTKPGFHETPLVSNNTALIYDTTSPQIRTITEQLDKYYQTQVRAGFNGSVLLGYKGHVIYERCYGYSNKEQKIPLGENSSCQLASISKTFTGGAIMYLYQHKHLDIDQPVTNYIKEFPYPGITVKMLLSHRSGLPDYTKWVPDHHNMSTPISNQEMMDMMVKYKPRLAFKPNTRFTYCNTNFAVLAMVIERVTEMRYADFMKQYIFQPLGMNHTFIYNPAEGLPAEATISYQYNWKREPDMFADGVCGDKGVYSTVEDMYRWDQSFYDNKLLSNETIELAYGPCSFEKKGVKNYGLGWRMLCFPNGNKIIYHNGWWHGNNTSFYRFIKDNFTIIVLGNKYSKTVYRQAPAIVNIVKGSSNPEELDTDD